jgi:hypothetical protein
MQTGLTKENAARPPQTVFLYLWVLMGRIDHMGADWKSGLINRWFLHSERLCSGYARDRFRTSIQIYLPAIKLRRPALSLIAGKLPANLGLDRHIEHKRPFIK